MNRKWLLYMILPSFLSKDEPIHMPSREPTFVTAMLDTRHIETISTKRNRFDITSRNCSNTCGSHGTLSLGCLLHDFLWFGDIWRLHPRRVPVLCVAIVVCLRTPWCDRVLNTWAAVQRKRWPKGHKYLSRVENRHKCYEENWHFKELISSHVTCQYQFQKHQKYVSQTNQQYVSQMHVWHWQIFYMTLSVGILVADQNMRQTRCHGLQWQIKKLPTHQRHPKSLPKRLNSNVDIFGARARRPWSR